MRPTPLSCRAALPALVLALAALTAHAPGQGAATRSDAHVKVTAKADKPGDDGDKPRHSGTRFRLSLA